MDVSEEVTGTLRAEEHGHQPCVLEAAGFCTEHSANARSIGYEEERSPTLRAGVVPAAIALENHPADSRVKISEDGKVQTLTSRCGTGGGNVPMVMDAVENPVESPVKDIENSPAITLKIRSGCEGGGKGAIWQEEKSATLGCNNDQTLFVPKCYGVCSKASHSMMSDNPHSGFYEAETSRTLDRSGGDPTCNQGGICVVEPVAFTQNQRDEVRDLGEKSAALAAEPGMKQQTFVAQPEEVTAFHVNQRNELIELHGKSGALMATRSDQMQTFVLQGNMIGRKDENGPQGDGVNEDVCFTLDATDRHAVTFDEIFKLYYALKAPYRKKAQFLCNEALVLQLMTIKDNNGNYIWKPGLEIGKPDTLLNRPLKTSAFMPEIKGGSKVMAFGDYSYYWVADRQNRTFRRLNELYARTDQVGFLTTQRVDGKLILPEAVQLLQMAPQG